MRIFKLTCLLLIAFVATATLQAYELEQKTWRKDARNLVRMNKLSVKMRANFRNFAKDFKDAETITGEQHALADQTIQAYAKIRHHLGVIEERWRDAIPSRLTMKDSLENRLRGGALTLAAATVMLDNAACMVESFKDTIWEKRLNQGAADRSKWHVDGLFRDVVRSLGSWADKRALLAKVNYLNDSYLELETVASREDLVIAALDMIIASTTVEEIENQDLVERVGNDVSAKVSNFGSVTAEGLGWLLGKISKVFGNTAGSIHLGKATVSGEVRDRVHGEMMELLEPGDILLDKTRFALTDKFIPGHFGHVAMWLGTGVEMEDLGLFKINTNKQSWKRAQEHEDKLRTGHSVLEALRPGVQVNTLEHFLNVDVVAVLRWKKATRNDIAPVLGRGLYHLGQEYDFNFDVNSSNTIVCSELVYQAFPESIKWPTSKTMGRATISPDDVAKLAGPSDELPFEVIYYHDSGNSFFGEEATKELLSALAAEHSS